MKFWKKIAYLLSFRHLLKNDIHNSQQTSFSCWHFSKIRSICYSLKKKAWKREITNEIPSHFHFRSNGTSCSLRHAILCNEHQLCLCLCECEWGCTIQHMFALWNTVATGPISMLVYCSYYKAMNHGSFRVEVPTILNYATYFSSNLAIESHIVKFVFPFL